MFKHEVTIATYMHRVGIWHPLQMRQIARHTRQPFRMVVINEPGSVHENINRALRACDTRYVVIMDDDCLVVTDDWLEKLLTTLTDTYNTACVTPREIKTARTLKKYLEKPESVVPYSTISSYAWLPGYMWCLDRDRCPDVFADEALPFPTGESDLDFTLQISKRGLFCSLTDEVVVYHPYKGPSSPEKNEECKHQIKYLRDKWGDDLVRAFQNSPSTILDNDFDKIQSPEDFLAVIP